MADKDNMKSAPPEALDSLNDLAEAMAPAVQPDTPPQWVEKTVPLIHPIDGPEGKIESLTFREPDVEALERIEELDIQKGDRIKVRHLRVIAAALSRQPDDLIRRVHASDFEKVTEAIVPFLEFAVSAEASS